MIYAFDVMVSVIDLYDGQSHYIGPKNKKQQLMQRNENEDGIMDGFSSEEEIRHEELLLDERKATQPEPTHKEQVKFKIPPPQEIQKKTYSLHPDMATGWAPKSDQPVPIPLIFSNRRVDSIVKRLVEKPHEKIKLCFLGPRFENTFYAWMDRPFPFPYSHIKSPQNMKFSNRAFCGQHWDAEDGLIFDSFFQSGNLDCAIRVGERQYDLYIRVDSNTRGHLQWFNFKVKNLEKLQKYRINVCNFQKNKSLYSRGQKPYVLSSKKLEKENKSWEQTGDSVKYQQKSGKSAKVLANDLNSYYKLSFDYYTEYDKDQVQMAYCVPYTYSQLNKFVAELDKKCASTFQPKLDQQFLEVTKLCTTLGGLEVPLLIVHQDDQKGKSLKQKLNSIDDEFAIAKKCVVISGRAHPGESNGSYMMEGFLDFICGKSKEAIQLRKNFIFKIVPMLNPDGVCLGNYRTGISGKDFNRQYRNPQKCIFPEVHSFKKLVSENKAIYQDNLLMFLDFHGHSIKKNVFMYGPEFPIIHRHYYECRVFPKLLGNNTPMFRYYSCSFKVSQFKVTTARAVLLRKLAIPLSYTIEASNGSYYDYQLLRDVPFSDSTWIKMGRSIGCSLAEYGEMVMISERMKITKMRQRKLKREMKTKKGNLSRKGSFSNCSKNIEAPEFSILSGSENTKIKKIFEEIRKADEEKQLSKIQDDDISEGSSDGEDAKDDLSPQKLNLLYQIIKNKQKGKNSPDKSRMRFVWEENSRTAKTTEGQMQQDLMANSKPHCEVSQIQLIPFQDQEVFKPNGNLRGYLLRNRHQTAVYEGKQTKEKVAARIINFSFIGHQRPQNFSADKRMLSNNKSQIAGSSTIRDEGKDRVQELVDHKNNICKNSKVLDLSDNNFRRTFLARTVSKESDRRNLSYVNMSPRRMAAKLDDFKYRRLVIDEFKL